MQQSPQMIPTVLPSFPPTNITTEQIQKYLDENKKLIMAILENQNLSKLAECAQYQALLQKNLMYLAAIADAQPQPPPAAVPTPGAMTPQAMLPHSSAMQPPPSYFIQQHQLAMGMGMPQHIPPGIVPPRGPLQFGNPHQLQDPQQQLHQQAMQGHMGIRPMGLNNNNGLQHQMHQPETTTLGPNNSGPNNASGGGKQDVSQSAADEQGGSAARHGSGDAKIEGK
ncbi:PREDICTED: GRF1-interacting factor 3-like isoform X1 [Camelina sativa]|uniref:GRF1-interacting factor 3-like isoform X1 n=1 Tax=Camelina sativa TaxID=90675 RepID=A0ABM0VHD5_CAMSA|nr:PREDICTED: GRF1-interacting factor 3-like isoform X1 [Camelina sativa]